MLFTCCDADLSSNQIVATDPDVYQYIGNTNFDYYQNTKM